MALRQIRVDGDPLLRKKSREITKIDDRIKILLDDMVETMYDANGVGLAAPQVGVLKRVIVIDVGEGLIALINPEVIDTCDQQTETEGCLRFTGIIGEVTRAAKVKVKGLTTEGKEIILEGEGLLARALQHEIDHLDGILFVDKAQDLRRQE